MKKKPSLLSVVLIFLLLSLHITPSFADDDQAKQIIAVLPLKNQGDNSLGAQGESIYQRVVQAFLAVKRFSVIERNQLDAILREGNFQNSAIVDEKTAVLMGKQIGAQYVVIGSYDGAITKVFEQSLQKYFFPAKLDVNLRVVDVRTGQISQSFTMRADARSDNDVSSMADLMDKISNRAETVVSNAYPVNGYVIKSFSNKEFLVDVGRDDGITTQSHFYVYEQGSDFVHPVTGKVIKGERYKVANARVKSVDAHTAIVKLSSIDKPVAVGMVIETTNDGGLFW